MAMFPKHILDFISAMTPEVNSNEQEMLDRERNKSFLSQFASRPSLEAQGLVPMPTEEQINSPTFKRDESIPLEVKKEDVVDANPLLNSKEMNQFTLDLGNQGREIQRGLAEAQRARDEQILRHQINEAGKQIGAGFSGAQEAPRGLDNMAIETAGNTVHDYLQKIQLDEQDPNSPVSKAFKQYAQKYNVNVKGDFTAAMGKQLLPFIFKSFEAEENRKLREELARQKNEELKLIKEHAQRVKEEHEDTTRYDTMNKLLASQLQRNNTAFGRNANIYRSAQAIEALVGGIRNLNELREPQIVELAKALDAMLTAGSPSISGTKMLIPKSYAGDVSRIKEYLTNRIAPANMGSFVKQLLETIQREKDVAKQQIFKTQKELTASYRDLYHKDPAKFKQFLIDKDLPADMMDLSPQEHNDKLNKESEGKKVVAQGYNPNTNETQFIYSDGTKKTLKGKRAPRDDRD